MVDGATAGDRYFDFRTATQMTAEVRGNAEGKLVVRDGRNGPVAACIPITPSEEWTCCSAPLSIGKGKHALYFTYEGTGAVDFKSFCFDK